MNEVVYKQRAKMLANQTVASQVNIAVKEVCSTQQDEVIKDESSSKVDN